MKTLVFSIIVSQVLGWINFDDYKTMCNGKGASCYTLWNDTSFNLPYNLIEKWYYLPAVANMNWSIGWAQSHAMASTWALWTMTYLPGINKDFKVLSINSFIYESLKVGLINCSTPTSLTPTQQRLLYVPFISVPSYTLNINFESDFPFDYIGRDYCNMTKLAATKPTGKTTYLFSRYNNIWYKPFTFAKVKQDIQDWGIGLVNMPHDFLMSSGFGYYPDGIFKLWGPVIYYYPANVVGVWNNGNTTYLLVYAFGALNCDTNYLWVDSKLVTFTNFITYIDPIF